MSFASIQGTNKDRDKRSLFLAYARSKQSLFFARLKMRIAGVELPDKKRVDFALTRLFGVGWGVSRKVLRQTGISPAKKTDQLSEEEAGLLTKVLENYTIEGELRRQTLQNIQRLKDTSSYRGLRHLHSLPARGQRTRTNARTKRGKRRTVGAFKKESLAKTGRFAEGQAKEEK